MVDKYLGIVLIAVVLFYLLRNANDTATVFTSFANSNARIITALQGQGAGMQQFMPGA